MTVRPRSVLLALAAGLALADASIVTLALPELLVDLNTSVEGVAAVIGVYTVVLAASLIPIERLARRHGAPRAGAAGFGAFAIASIACAGADSLAVLLVARALQAAGGAAALIATFTLLADHDRDDHGPAPSARNLWLGAAVLSAAVGPALGGALTQAFSWPAIFIVQVPIAALAAVICVRMPEPVPATAAPPTATDDPAGATDWRAALALGLVSAALSAVLFLLVLLLVAGWAVQPLKAAGAVTVVPLAALAAARVRGDARWRAAAGCMLVGFGTLALAYLPDARLWWTIAPQALAGFGMGLALPALGGELLPERNTRDAARLLAIRHVGIAIALAAIAPVTAARLDDATFKARESGVALALDAKLDPARKVALAPALLASVDAESPRLALRKAIDENRGTVSGDERTEYDRLAVRADETLVDAVGDSFFAAFAITGLLAIAGGALLVRARPRAPAWVVGTAVAGCLVLAVQVVAWDRQAPDPVTIADPCQARELPSTGGVSGFLQDQALQLLDSGACKFGSTREELVLALSDDDDAQRFEQRHGVNPRSVGGILSGLLG
jgi:MFS family permease